MAKMKAIEAAVKVLEKEGVSVTFGVPGAAINPLYAAMKEHGGIGHILARHVEGASHMAEGYTRAVAGNIGPTLLDTLSERLDTGTLRPLFGITAPAAHPYQVRSRDDSPAAAAFVAWLDDVCARSRAHAAEWLSGLT